MEQLRGGKLSLHTTFQKVQYEACSPVFSRILVDCETAIRAEKYKGLGTIWVRRGLVTHMSKRLKSSSMALLFNCFQFSAVSRTFGKQPVPKDENQKCKLWKVRLASKLPCSSRVYKNVTFYEGGFFT